MTDDELIAKYVEHMRWRRLRPTTIDTRTRYLEKFAREVGFAKATPELIQSWLSRPSLQPQSQRSWLTTLHVAYKWGNEAGYFEKVLDLRGEKVDFDPTHDILKPKTRKGKPHPIASADLQRALDAADPLMRCWLLVGAFEGARCQEIAGIRREDVHEDDPEPWLNIEFGKGNKSREVPLHPDVIAALRALPMRATGPLWDMTPQQMSKGIGAHLRKVKAKTIAGTPATAHALRHLFGTMLYQKCLDLQLVADLMGHANTAVTSVYAAADHRKASALVASLTV
jgi:integrase